MTGFEYINAWDFPSTPIATLISGVAMIISIVGLGKYLLRITGENIPEPWLSVVSIVLGVLVFSLAVQTVSMLGIASKWLLISLIFLILPFGISFLSKGHFLIKIIPPYHGYAKFPAAIVLIAMLINLLVALAPSTKIDELAYHMLLPSRILNDGALIYYQMPWEAAILPHMLYQIMVAPLYALGLPDSANVVSFSLFSILIWFALTLVWQKTKHTVLAWWVAASMSVGMYSVVSLITGGGHSFMVLSTAVGVISVFSRQNLLKDISLSAWVLMCSILLLGMVASKVSLIPMVLLLLLGVFWQIIKDEEYHLPRIKMILVMAMPWILLYFPIITWTWVNSGSPFGPLFSDFFSVDTTTLDPLVASVNKEIGDRPPLTDILFLTIVNWSPLIWIALVGVALTDRLNLTLRILFFVLIIIQLTIIAVVLPHKARHLSGLQYVIPIVASIFYAPVQFNNGQFRRIVIGFAALLTLPWLTIQAYYAKPLMAMTLGLYSKNDFLNKYVPFFTDLIHLDRVLPYDAKILVAGDTRVDAAYFPRPTYMSFRDFYINKGPGYLFLVGKEQQLSSLNLKIGRQVYENMNAVEFTYRTPGRAHKINQLKVFEVIGLVE